MLERLKQHSQRSWRKLTRSHPEPSFEPGLAISSAARAVIEREVMTFSLSLETGGILIGHSEPSGLVRVTFASGPGPKAVHLPTYFLRDTQYCANILREHYAQSGADYVGEWHSHVGRMPRPSGGDLMTLNGIMSDPDYDFNVFAMIIVVSSRRLRHRRLKLNGFIATKKQITRIKIRNL